MTFTFALEKAPLQGTLTAIADRLIPELKEIATKAVCSVGCLGVYSGVFFAKVLYCIELQDGCLICSRTVIVAGE